MTKPTADSTAAAESWVRSHRDLHALLDQALEVPEIADALEREDIPPAEARAVILEDPNVLAELRVTRESRKRSWATPGVGLGLRSRRLPRAPMVLRAGIVAAAIVGYLGLLTVSEPAMPWWADLFGFVGLFATFGFAVGIVGEDLLRVVERGVQDRTGEWSYALDVVIVPRLRQFVAERRAPDYGTTLSLHGVRNLYQDDDDAPVIITPAGQRLRRVMERSISDAVALAGARGVGKTTAIGAVADGMFSDPSTPPPMAVIASAPSRYEARDFVLHLHAVLAKRVITRTGFLLGTYQRSSRGKAIWLTLVRWLAISAGVPAALLGAAFLVAGESFPRFVADVRDFGAETAANFPQHIVDLLWIFDDRGVPPRLGGAAALLVGAAAVVVIISVLAAVFWLLGRLHTALRRRARARALPDVVALRASAERQLDRIRFLQTYTSGWSGKIGIPLGSSDVGWARGGQRAEQQLTHPEVVDSFREFAGRAAAVLIEQGVIERIVIAACATACPVACRGTCGAPRST